MKDVVAFWGNIGGDCMYIPEHHTTNTEDIMRIDIPFSDLPIYQLLARRRELKFSDVSLYNADDILRIKFELHGDIKNETLFTDDMNFIELYEDDLDKIFTGCLPDCIDRRKLYNDEDKETFYGLGPLPNSNVKINEVME